MLMPSRTKYRKRQKGRIKGNAKGGNNIDFGSFAIQAVDRGFLTSRHIEASRRAMTRHMKRGGKVWIRVFPDKPVSKKPAETRMGKGKGSLDHWVCPVKPGRIIFEVEGVDASVAKHAFELAQAKLPIKTVIISREEST